MLFQAVQRIPLLVYLDFQFEQSPTSQDASFPKLTHDDLYIAISPDLFPRAANPAEK